MQRKLSFDQVSQPSKRVKPVDGGALQLHTVISDIKSSTTYTVSCKKCISAVPKQPTLIVVIENMSYGLLYIGKNLSLFAYFTNKLSFEKILQLRVLYCFMCWSDNDVTRKSSWIKPNYLFKAYQVPKVSTVVCNSHRQDFTSLKSYHIVDCFVFGCDDLEINNRNTAFTLQRNWNVHLHVCDCQTQSLAGYHVVAELFCCIKLHCCTATPHLMLSLCQHLNKQKVLCCFTLFVCVNTALLMVN